MGCCGRRRDSRLLQVGHALVLHFQQRLQISDPLFQLGDAIVGFLDRLFASDDLFFQCMNTCSRLGVATRGPPAARGRFVLRQLQDFLGRSLAVPPALRLRRSPCRPQPAGPAAQPELPRPCRRRQLLPVRSPIARLSLTSLRASASVSRGELVGRRQLKNFSGLQPVHVLAGESIRIVPDQQYQHLFETDIRAAWSHLQSCQAYRHS